MYVKDEFSKFCYEHNIPYSQFELNAMELRKIDPNQFIYMKRAYQLLVVRSYRWIRGLHLKHAFKH